MDANGAGLTERYRAGGGLVRVPRAADERGAAFLPAGEVQARAGLERSEASPFGRELVLDVAEVLAFRVAHVAADQLAHPHVAKLRLAASLRVGCLGRRLRPDVSLIVTSGAVTVGKEELPDSGTFLPKPYPTRKLVQIVERQLDGAVADPVS